MTKCCVTGFGDSNMFGDLSAGGVAVAKLIGVDKLLTGVGYSWIGGNTGTT